MAETNAKPESFDTDQQYLGTVYAKALLGAADKAGTTEAVLSELDSLIMDVLDSLPKLEATLSSPRVSNENKIGILDKAFGKKMTKELLNFLKVVVGHGRFDCLRAIRRATRRIYNEMRGRVEVEVRTAEVVDSELLSTITTRLRAALGRDIDLTTRVDPELIGGMLVRVGDTVYDGSVINQLSRLRVATLEKTSREIREALDRFALAE